MPKPRPGDVDGAPPSPARFPSGGLVLQGSTGGSLVPHSQLPGSRVALSVATGRTPNDAE